MLLRTETESPRIAAKTGYMPIEGYAMVGDLYTVALVGNDRLVAVFPISTRRAYSAALLDCPARRAGSTHVRVAMLPAGIGASC